MKSRTRIEATIETQEVWVIRRPQRTATVCAECEAQALMLTPEQAAALAEVSLRNVYRRVEEGGVHFVEAADGGLRLCIATFMQAAVKRP